MNVLPDEIIIEIISYLSSLSYRLTSHKFSQIINNDRKYKMIKSKIPYSFRRLTCLTIWNTECDNSVISGLHQLTYLDLGNNKIISDDKQKLSSLVQSLIGLHDHDFTISLENNKAVIKSGTKLSDQTKEVFTKKVKVIIPNIDVSFSE